MTGFPPPPASGQRLLRRSRTDRVAAGVASGLGEYFNVDPVLFRVLFATSAFFGGAGILAYVLAWAAIPEAGTQRAPIDGWIASLRARRVPVWAVVIVGGLVLWAAAFSWWAPGPAFPVVALIVLLIVFFARRELRTSVPPAPLDPAGPVSFDKAAAPTTPGAAPQPIPSTQPTWVHDARAWLDESRAAARERRRRALPVRIGVLVALVGSLTCLAIADAVTGIQLQWYFWTTLIVLGAGALVGLVTRRWTWTVVPLLVPATIGAVAFAGSDASLHDGIGQRDWKPVAATSHTHYRLAFGQGVLDLRGLPTTTPSHLEVSLGAGQVKVIVPRTMPVTIRTDVHAGDVEVDGRHRHAGFEFTRVIDLHHAATTPAAVTVDVHLTDGNLDVVRR